MIPVVSGSRKLSPAGFGRSISRYETNYPADYACRHNPIGVKW
jgi:hypothetical protein